MVDRSLHPLRSVPTHCQPQTSRHLHTIEKMQLGVSFAQSCRLHSYSTALFSNTQQCRRLYGSLEHRCCPRVPPLKATSDKEDTAQESRADADEELLPIEEELRRRRRSSKKGRVNVVAPQVQQAYGEQPPTVEGQLEGGYLTLLAIGFVIILLQGLFLALSGFLPESADQFAADVVYPAFSPSVGIFLALSAAYGVWKSRQ